MSEYLLRTDNFGWETVGETTTAYTTPGVTERDYTNLVANHTDAIVFTLEPFRWNTMGLRIVVDDDGDDTVFDVFASKGQDYFQKVCTLTCKGGTQTGPATSTETTSGVFCDTITVSAEQWITSLVFVQEASTNELGTVWIDLKGYDTWALIGTTVDDTTLVQATGY